ncbi:MAG: hormogonium polysaccharide secretion pseudopilin HpsC [Microcoleus sp.]
MKTLLRFLIKSQHQRNRSESDQTEKGMTLVELLVGAIMAFLIITPMLTFVVDMLNTDRREQVKSNTEQDLQAAADFIAQDLSQAIYIYDNNPATTSTPTTTPTGIPAIRSQLPNNGDPNRIPILVFWKQQPRKNSVPFNPEVAKKVKPNTCDQPANARQCDDTYVLTLVAYYLFKDSDATWCQPSGGTCPTRIARYEITDGIKDPNATDTTVPNYPYYKDSETKDTQQRDPAFNKDFDLSKPTVNVTVPTELINNKSGATKPQVLVNYIDHTKNSDTALLGTECRTALGNPTDPKTTQLLAETTLKVTDTEGMNSFYACVNTEKNIAKVTIRGNSLRRLQANDADFKTTSSAFFPTATVQVQGLGARGK